MTASIVQDSIRKLIKDEGGHGLPHGNFLARPLLTRAYSLPCFRLLVYKPVLRSSSSKHWGRCAHPLQVDLLEITLTP